MRERKIFHEHENFLRKVLCKNTKNENCVREIRTKIFFSLLNNIYTRSRKLNIYVTMLTRNIFGHIINNLKITFFLKFL